MPRTLGLLVSLLAVAGCGADGPTRFESLDEPLEVRSGEPFEVALDANASTGYEWRLVKKPAAEVLRYKGSEYVPDPGADDLAGGGGEQILQFEAEEAGKTQIKLEYVFTGGEPGRPPATRASGTVIVR